MTWIFWIFVFVDLTVVMAIDKQLDGTSQRIWAPWKAPWPAHQPGQIMAKLSIHPFNWKGICFPLRNRKLAGIVDEGWIYRKRIAKILLCLGAGINQVLKAFLVSYPEHTPTDYTSCFSLYSSDYVDAFFLVSMKVKSSSNSIVCSSSGKGASGSWAAKALTQLITLVWWTPKWRAIRR